MELLKEITEKELGISGVTTEGTYEVKKTARTILFNDFGQIALVFEAKNNFHMNPGGGVDDEEDVIEALKREVLEEVGAQIEVLGEIGCSIEYRKELQQMRLSYCYYSRFIGELTKPTLTEQEIEVGSELRWVDYYKAIDILENDLPSNYIGKFIRERDLAFLRYAKEKNIVLRRI